MSSRFMFVAKLALQWEQHVVDKGSFKHNCLCCHKVVKLSINILVIISKLMLQLLIKHILIVSWNQQLWIQNAWSHHYRSHLCQHWASENPPPNALAISPMTSLICATMTYRILFPLIERFIIICLGTFVHDSKTIML